MNLTIDKILAAFGNIRAMERTHIDNHTEDIINSIEDKAFAISEQNVMYTSVKELGGYYYLKTVVVGSLKIKTMKGASLILHGKGFDLELPTDMDEFESDHSNISNRYITRIDFQIQEDDASKIDSNILNSVVLKAKKNLINFKIIKN